MNSSNSTPMLAKNCTEMESKARRSARSYPAALFCEPLLQNHSNFKRSSRPERLMFYENGSWVDYSEEVSDLMKLGFIEGKPMFEAQVKGLNTFFDFCRMLEIDLDTGNQRSIAWIDVDGKCFFPKSFINSYEDDVEADLVNCDENCAKIEIDIKIRENLGSTECSESNKDVNLSKRKRDENVEKEKMEESFCSFNAKRRQIVGSELQSSRWPKARILGAEEKGYWIVQNLFLSGLEILDPGATVTSIHQCVRKGPLDKARSEVFAKQMEIMKRARGDSNMVFAWYGTSAKGVESILMHGFGITSKPRFQGHGTGIYLSPIRLPQNSAMLSEMDENGEKHVILCRVILGKCEKVEAGSRQLYPSSVEYDTGVDDLNDPKWYTVWHANMNTHILPECVVSYRPVNMHGSVNAVSKNWVPHPTIFIGKLFLKLKSFLPSPQFQELQTSWASCKEGKLGKDAFMKKLRLVVGDDVLRSTIHEIRG